jgi:pimeloyl-ACP methyl ester carboxylesterase
MPSQYRSRLAARTARMVGTRSADGRTHLERCVSRVLTTVGVAVAASLLIVSAAPAKPRRGPSGAAFYRVPSPLPGKKHGDLIWWRKASRVGALVGARSNRLVLYRSRGVAGRIAVSGIVSVPRGKPPRGGWPVISWGPGGTGIADRCAVTRNRRLLRFWSPLYESSLKRGYAVVITDYEGRGTPRWVFPAFNGPSEGRGVLDIVRAARRLDRRIGRRVIVGGHSQGGQAALFAASLAPRYTPELKVRGTAALAPTSHTGELFPALVTIKTPNPAISTALMITLRGLDLARPSLHVREALSDTANARYGLLDRRCVDELPVSFGGIAPADLFKPGIDFAPFVRALERLSDPENLTIRTPVRIDQGTADTGVLPVFTEQMVDAYRARGTRVTYKTHEGADHDGVVKAAAEDATAWISRRLR